MTFCHSSTGYSQFLNDGPAMPALQTRISMPPSEPVVASRPCLDRSELGHVDRAADHLAAELASSAVSRFQERCVAIPDRHRGAGGEKPLDDGPADTLGPTRDHGPPALEIDPVHSSSLLCHGRATDPATSCPSDTV